MAARMGMMICGSISAAPTEGLLLLPKALRVVGLFSFAALLRFNPGTQGFQLLEKAHVLVHPGYFFDFNEDYYIVISLLPPQKVFIEGVGRILDQLCTQTEIC